MTITLCVCVCVFVCVCGGRRVTGERKKRAKGGRIWRERDGGKEMGRKRDDKCAG